MQQSLNLVNTPKPAFNEQDVIFSKRVADNSPQDFLDSSDKEFWQEDELKKMFSVERSSFEITLSEWKFLSCMFLQMCMTKKSRNMPCDFLIIGSSWYNDETAIRHLSFGNWGTSTHDTGYRDLLDTTETDGAECLNTDLVQAGHHILKERGLADLSEELSLQSYISSMLAEKPYAKSTDNFAWKLINGGTTDWDQLVTDLSDEERDHMSYDNLICTSYHDEGSLVLIYMNQKHNLVVKELASTYTTEPRVVTDDNYEITWNY